MEVETVVVWPILVEHGLALAMIWGLVALTGFAWLLFARLGVGLAGTPFLGVIFWAIATYCFPFTGGLDWAGALVIALFTLAAIQFYWRGQSNLFPRIRLSTVILAVGLFAARLLWQLQHPNRRVSLAPGAAIAAIPLIHGVGAGTWLYCAGPWIVLAALAKSRDKYEIG